MSRRTKLILLGTLLIPLSASLSYVAWTWNPRGQPQVRVLPEVKPDFLAGWSQHGVLVENKSSVPLCVYTLERDITPAMPDLGIYSMLPRVKRIQAWQEQRIFIPSHSSVRMEVSVPETESLDRVLCVYTTSTRDFIIRLLDWCYLNSPVSVKKFIPELQPHHSRESISLISED